MSLGERKRAELDRKAAGLTEEFDHWLQISAPGGDLEKHCTQIRAITSVLTLHVASLDADCNGAGEQAILAGAAGRERDLLAVHRIWDFFRAKLALRFVPWFGEYLGVADELAWSCYEPAQRRVEGDVGKEPPLVYLNGGSSPLTLPRGSGWLAEQVPDEELRAEQLEDALRELPIPVIGVPWFHARHLPDAPVIGHEVGHDVERDLGLTAVLRSLVGRGLCASRAPEDRRAAWQSWCGELFADVYGTLAGGPAYVGALMDFVAGPRHRVVQEWRGNGAWGSYPTRTLRVLACTRVLERLELGEQASLLRERWRAAYPSHAMSDHEDDVPHVVDALVDGGWPQLGGGPLTSLIAFTPAMQDAVERGAERLLKGRMPGTPDVRCTLAAARRAYERDAARYVRMRAATWTVQQVAALKRAGPRGSGETAPAQSDRDERDRRSAARLADSLARARVMSDGGDDDE
jgi:hypothetical protein